MTFGAYGGGVITTTHVVTNMLLARRARADENSGGVPTVLSADPKWFAIGGFAPDVGLYLLTAGAAAYFPLVRDMSFRESMEYAFNTLFFEDPVWIAVQNTLHSPVVLAGLLAAGKVKKSSRLMAFAAGCLLHTAMDIPVHHNDGPLVFFPFDWSYRFDSPVSYYDRDHYGQIVAPIDLAITVLGGAYLIRERIKNKRFW